MIQRLPGETWRPVIALDCDGVICDFHGAAVDWVRGLGYERTRQQAHCWDLFKAWGLEKLESAFNRHVDQRGWCSSLNRIRGASAFVEGLREVGRVVITTSPFNSTHWVRERQAWLKEHFGFEKKDVIHVNDKSLIAADILIDDGPHNVEAFGLARSVLIDQPWNRSMVGVTRAMDLPDALRIVKERFPQK